MFPRDIYKRCHPREPHQQRRSWRRRRVHVELGELNCVDLLCQVLLEAGFTPGVDRSTAPVNRAAVLRAKAALEARGFGGARR